jgi:hypothetical protein
MPNDPFQRTRATKRIGRVGRPTTSCCPTVNYSHSRKRWVKQDMRIYADTSVFGGMFDEEFAEATKKFFF